MATKKARRKPTQRKASAPPKFVQLAASSASEEMAGAIYALDADGGVWMYEEAGDDDDVRCYWRNLRSERRIKAVG